MSDDHSSASPHPTPELWLNTSRQLRRHWMPEKANLALEQALTAQPQILQSAQFRGAHPADQANQRTPQPFIAVSCEKCGSHLLSDMLQALTGLAFHWPDDTTLQPLQNDPYFTRPEGSFLIGHFPAHPEWTARLTAANVRVVMLYRDPRDALVSFYHHYIDVNCWGDQGNLLGRFLASLPKSEALNLMITGYTPTAERSETWTGLPSRQWHWVRNWIGSGLPYLALRYEDVITDKAGALQQLGDFLGYALNPEQRQTIVAQTAFEQSSATMTRNNLPASFKRKGRAGDWRNHFSPSNTRLFELVAGEQLRQLGYA
ncbi:sulfotransferase domain-containing protein [Magnetofaba australis]|uniref:Putative sulfotransferase family, cytosolic, 6B, member 1 n=1 Tax=Magnetofaba australis IT-1 TaxID=1434232 RepID=A0A1Y2K1N6_9PROT|nr:sulfotransferase domain-containing protein [Magnetofaba australis]OSM00102.1 putative sulfotransferase family, cytosolic, 6B, member 1 [Magnetofaba australis IT-1]